MKKRTATILVAAALILGGLLVSFCGLLLIDFDPFRLETAPAETRTESVSADFSRLSVEVSDAGVRLYPSADGTCTVVSALPEKVSLTLSVENGTLSIRENDARRWYDRIGVSFHSYSVSVYLPDKIYDSLTASASVGHVEIARGLSFDSVSVTTDTGRVSCFATVSGSLSLTTDTGSITLIGISPTTATLRTTTGEIRLERVNVGETLMIGTSTGSVSLNDVTAKDLSVETSTGHVHSETLLVTDALRIETNTGHVSLDNSDAGSISITTDTGHVDLILLSGKNFDADSDTGKILVPPSSSGGPCKIRTDTGRISVTVMN